MAADNTLVIDCSTEGGTLRITPRGEVDLSTSPKLRMSLQAALTDGDLPVEIILSEVPYMDSSGVATLVEALQVCRRQDRQLTLVRPSHRVASIFKISKLDAVFTIRDDQS